MQRSSFVRAALGAAGLAQLPRAAMAGALDEAAVGAETFADLRDSDQVLFDSPFYERLGEVGATIALAVRARYEYPLRFYIVRGDQANAFSVPGGNIYLNEPLLRLTRNRDELAGVLAHEAGHMLLHHVAKRIASAQAAGALSTMLSIPAQLFLGPLLAIPAQGALNGIELAQSSNLSKHSESAADAEGARIMAATGEFNPYGMIWFFERMFKKYGNKGNPWLRSHPFDTARVADLLRLFRSDPKTFGAFAPVVAAEDTYW